MKSESIQIQTAVRLLLEYLFEQKEILKAAIAVQRVDNADDKSVHAIETVHHSVSSSELSASSGAPGSSNTIS